MEMLRTCTVAAQAAWQVYVQCRKCAAGAHRMYVEQYSNDKSTYGKDAQEVLKTIIDTALRVSKLPELTGRDKPTVIT